MCRFSYVLFMFFFVLTRLPPCFFFLMTRPPPGSNRTDTLFPYTTLFRSGTVDDPFEARAGEVDEVLVIDAGWARRSEEHTSELQSLMRISYAVFCLKKKNSKDVYR